MPADVNSHLSKVGHQQLPVESSLRAGLLFHAGEQDGKKEAANRWSPNANVLGSRKAAGRYVGQEFRHQGLACMSNGARRGGE